MFSPTYLLVCCCRRSAVEMCLISQLSTNYHSIMVLTTVSFLDLYLHTVVVLYATPTLLVFLSSSLFHVFVVLLYLLVYVRAYFFAVRPFSSVYSYDITSIAVYFYVCMVFQKFQIITVRGLWYKMYLSVFFLFSLCFSSICHISLLFVFHSLHHHGPCKETCLHRRQG